MKCKIKNNNAEMVWENVFHKFTNILEIENQKQSSIDLSNKIHMGYSSAIEMKNFDQWDSTNIVNRIYLHVYIDLGYILGFFHIENEKIE